ncbi:hypothetical protein Y032_0373g166 [Ancylostoma ceylanicum]|uniref:Uncharacterized protein n=1 Tax=Ancylostoma ceylanicum TaxID=53326 RepID=A0A016RU12_9BILA|nr:hypothetical protein Y032_0373g166 [Ancylostoma ceylanicum]
MINLLSFQSPFNSRPCNSAIFCKRAKVVAMEIAFFVGFVNINHYFRRRYSARPRNTVKPEKAKFPWVLPRVATIAILFPFRFKSSYQIL